jgi:hypothetical protein
MLQVKEAQQVSSPQEEPVWREARLLGHECRAPRLPVRLDQTSSRELLSLRNLPTSLVLQLPALTLERGAADYDLPFDASTRSAPARAKPSACLSSSSRLDEFAVSSGGCSARAGPDRGSATAVHPPQPALSRPRPSSRPLLAPSLERLVAFNLVRLRADHDQDEDGEASHCSSTPAPP